jgi:hypothetical protein
MKYILTLLFCITTMLFSCNSKKTADNDVSAEVATDTLPDYYASLEGKVVMSDKGDWFVIKEGVRWRAMSEPATTDYLNSILNGKNNVVKNVTTKTLEQFPIVGEILPKLEFKKDQK